MLGFMAAGLMTVMCILMLMARTDMRKWLGYSNWLDVALTVVMIIMFHGSFSGVVSAACAGVFMSCSFWILRQVLGYKRLQRRGWRLVWATYPPKWKEKGNVEKVGHDPFSLA